MFKLLTRVMLRSWLSITSLPDRIAIWIRVRVLQQHKKIKLQSTFKSSSDGKYAVFALYPGTTTLQSCQRILLSLIENNYSVILVINENKISDSWTKQFLKYECTLIERPNIGRDFGAYQAGIKFIWKNVEKQSINKILLVNDTNFVSPKCKDKFLDNFLSNDDFNCAFRHMQAVIHASAHLITIDKTKVNSIEFQNFWNKYYPQNIRTKVVTSGEHGLSRTLGNDYFRPATGVLNDDNHELNLDELNQLLLTFRRSNQDFVSTISNSRYAQTGELENYLIKFSLENHQISNALGLYLARRYYFPLKLDLALYGVTTKKAIIDCLKVNGCQSDELLEIQKILDSKQISSMDTAMKRIFGRLTSQNY